MAWKCSAERRTLDRYNRIGSTSFSWLSACRVSSPGSDAPSGNEGVNSSCLRRFPGGQFEPLSFYEKFEQVCVLILTGLIAVIVVLSLWNLALNILLSILSSTFDPTEYAVFQNVFGTIFTVIIALEFKRSLLLPSYRSFGIVQVRTVIRRRTFNVAGARENKYCDG